MALNLGRLLQHAVSSNLDKLSYLPVLPNISSIDMRRGNGKHGPQITIEVPDELVKNLRGRHEERDVLIFLRIPRAIADQAESPIILPHELHLKGPKRLAG